jgi:hypothetical protein
MSGEDCQLLTAAAAADSLGQEVLEILGEYGEQVV